MPNEQPLVSVGSNNRVSRVRINGPWGLFIGIGTTMLMGFFIYCLWPFHTWIGIGMIIFVGYLMLAAMTWVAITLWRLLLDAVIVPAPEHGMIDKRRWQHLPTLPPPTITVQETHNEPTIDKTKQALDVLQMHHDGLGYQSIADNYKRVGDTYWTVWRVRKLIEESERWQDDGLSTPAESKRKREKSTRKREE